MPVNDSGEELVKRLYRMAEANPYGAAEILTACKANTPAVFERLSTRLAVLKDLADQVAGLPQRSS